MNAVMEVVDVIYRHEAYSHQFPQAGLLITLDLRDAFNSATSPDMLDTLESRVTLHAWATSITPFCMWKTG